MSYPAKMSNPGSAPIIRAGHTESDSHGTNTHASVAGGTPVRDLEIATSKSTAGTK